MSGPQRSGAQQPAPRGLSAREQPCLLRCPGLRARQGSSLTPALQGGPTPQGSWWNPGSGLVVSESPSGRVLRDCCPGATVPSRPNQEAPSLPRLQPGSALSVQTRGVSAPIIPCALCPVVVRLHCVHGLLFRARFLIVCNRHGPRMFPSLCVLAPSCLSPLPPVRLPCHVTMSSPLLLHSA